MTQEKYDNFLARNSLSQAIIKDFFEDTLIHEEDILRFADRARAFCRKHDINPASEDTLGLQFVRSLVAKMISWRTKNGYIGNDTVFTPHLPEPSRDAINESWRHRDNQEREFRYRSERRRGFYRNGEPTQTCGEDLTVQMYLYEYKAKG